MVFLGFFGTVTQTTEGSTSQFGSIGSAILSKLMTGGIVIVLVVLMCAVIICVALYTRYLSQFVYDVEIKSLRSSGLMGNKASYKIIKDKGAIIRNKRDKTTWFRIKNQFVDLPVPPLEAIQLGVKGKNYIKILQKSDDEYYYLLPDTIDTEVVVRNGETIKIGQQSVKVIDGDVGYWNIQKKKENKKLFDAESMLMKLLPYIIPVLMFMLVIFMTYFITQHWGEFAAAAQSLERAANALSGTTTATVTTG